MTHQHYQLRPSTQLCFCPLLSVPLLTFWTPAFVGVWPLLNHKRRRGLLRGRHECWLACADTTQASAVSSHWLILLPRSPQWSRGSMTLHVMHWCGGSFARVVCTPALHHHRDIKAALGLKYMHSLLHKCLWQLQWLTKAGYCLVIITAKPSWFVSNINFYLSCKTFDEKQVKWSSTLFLWQKTPSVDRESCTGSAWIKGLK